MAEKRNTAGRKREVVEMMLSGADRTSLVTKRMKKLYERGQNGEKEGQRETASPEEYAADTVQEEIERAPRESIHAVRQVSRTAERIKRVKESRERASHTPSARAAGTSKTVPAEEQMRAFALKQVERVAKKVSATGGKKAAGSAARSMVKTTKQAAARAKKAVVNSAKAIYHGIKSSSALIAAGGGVAVFVILLICMVAMIFGSAFGIFFTGTQTGSSSQRTIRAVMSELDAEYDQTILSIQGSTEHDVLEFHGARPEWKGVLAVYAVKTNLDPNDSDELITMTKKKERKLRDVFWDMVSVSSKVEIEKREVTTSVTDESGNVTEKTEEKEVVVLTIRTTNRSANEMVVDYGFDPEQEELLKELLDSSNDPLWAGVIY